MTAIDIFTIVLSVGALAFSIDTIPGCKLKIDDDHPQQSAKGFDQ